MTTDKNTKKPSFWDQPEIQAQIKQYQELEDQRNEKLGIKKSALPSKYDKYKNMSKEELLYRKKIILEKLRDIPYEDIDRKWWYFSDRQFLKFCKYCTYGYIIHEVYQYLKSFF